ncbi:MAG: hypothetical protein ABSD27_13885 [Bryobacteraceae bacterium]|jgi:hypothetical protein
MITYFSRHTQELNIDHETRKRLWDERRIAIHFPDDKQGKQLPDDNSSLDPEDYAAPGHRAMKALARLATDGGYVCAQHHGYEQVQVGRIDPGSQMELLHGKWGESCGLQGRTAILKTLRLQKVKVVDSCDSVVILIGRPRQGTLMRWPSVGKRIENLVEGKEGEITLETLSPAQQEILCSEFLRSQDVRRFGLPCLAHLVLPVGRTMKDLDLFGFATDGRRVFAQVTFAPLEQAARKMAALRKYASPDGSHLILFCDIDRPTVIDNVTVFPIRVAFQVFTSTDAGRLWLKYAGPKCS